jgi:hypothetical protein
MIEKSRNWLKIAEKEPITIIWPKIWILHQILPTINFTFKSEILKNPNSFLEQSPVPIIPYPVSRIQYAVRLS